MKRILYTLILTLLTYSLSSAQGSPLSLTDGVPGARSLALGKLHTPAAGDMYLYSNPAAFLSCVEKGATLQVDGGVEIFPRMETGRELGYTLTGAFALTRSQVLLVGGRYIGGLEVPLVGMPGETAAGSISPRSWSADLAYAYGREHWRIFARGSYLQTELQEAGRSVLFGAGADYLGSYRLGGEEISYGLHTAVESLGTPLRYSSSKAEIRLLPTLEVSMDQTIPLADRHTLTLLLGARGTLLEGPGKYRTAALGLEYSYDRLVDVRLGYDYHTLREHTLAAGLGGTLFGVHLDVAYQHGLSPYAVRTVMVSGGYTF